MPEKDNRCQNNETIRLLHERASLRSYDSRPIEPEVLDTILKAGIHSPTGGNLQPYSIIQVNKRETMERLGELCWQKFIGTAAVNLIFCLDLRRHKRLAEIGIAPHTAYHSFRHFWVSFQDTLIAAQNICTAADALGLGSCYVATILEHVEEICSIFKIPVGVFPVVLLTLGYPKVKPSISNKFGTDIMVHQDTYKDIPDETLYDAYLKRENNKQLAPGKERLERIKLACRRTSGEDFAEKCEREIKNAGYINPIQYRFGLHYKADEMAQDNLEFLAQLEKQGFDWFKEWVPLEE
jgi:nitroreductase